MRKLIVAFLVLALGSCQSGKQAPATASQNGTGIIAGSITFEGDAPRNDIYRFFYNALTEDKKFRKANSGKIEIKAREGSARAFTGDSPDKKTYYFTIEGAPGNYAFTQYSYLDHIGYSGMVSSSKKFSIPFEIKADQVIYIGDLQYNDDAQPGAPRIKVRNRLSDDLPGLKSKYPLVKWDKADNKTVRAGDTGNGIVEFQLQ